MHKHLPRDMKKIISPYLSKAAAPTAGKYSDKYVAVKVEDLLRLWELAHQTASLRSMR